MVNWKKGELMKSFLLNLLRAAVTSEVSTEEPMVSEDFLATDETTPVEAYWDKDIKELQKTKRPFIDLFFKDVALNRIPDTTEKPIAESHYDFDRLSQVFLPGLKNLNENLKQIPNLPGSGKVYNLCLFKFNILKSIRLVKSLGRHTDSFIELGAC